MKVKINIEWLEQNVFNHHPQVREIIAEHNCTGVYQYDVNVRGAGKYGVRVGFFDKRLYRGKFYVTPTEGNYQMVAE